jgi:hypothetical protein
LPAGPQCHTLSNQVAYAGSQITISRTLLLHYCYINKYVRLFLAFQAAKTYIIVCEPLQRLWQACCCCVGTLQSALVMHWFHCNSHQLTCLGRSNIPCPIPEPSYPSTFTRACPSLPEHP